MAQRLDIVEEKFLNTIKKEKLIVYCRKPSIKIRIVTIPLVMVFFYF